jgi:hypothetical protein
MLGAIVDQVAALAQRGEVAWAIVAGIVIEVGGGEYDPGAWKRRDDRRSVEAELLGQPLGREGHPYPAAPAVTPAATLFIVPTTITYVLDILPMRPATLLAPPPSAPETHYRREFAPINRIKPAVLRADRHLSLYASF